jgi:hypothetical protein
VKYKLGLMAVAVVLVAAACSGSTTGTSQTASATTAPLAVDLTAAESAPCPTEGEEWETALLYIEHNAPDEDTGVHGLFGGHGHSELCIWSPDGRLIMLVDPTGQLNDLTVADVFFESREPPNSEVSIADIEAAVPAGEYRVAGTDFEGVPRVGSALFTHAIPAEPNITAPELTEDAETADEATVPTTGLVVRWEPVTETIDGEPVVVTAYEVIVTKDDHEDPNARTRPIYDVIVGPEATSLSVPADFLEPDTVYELEVLALEESGNQTISLGYFTTEAAQDAAAGGFADVRAFIEYNADPAPARAIDQSTSSGTACDGSPPATTNVGCAA